MPIMTSRVAPYTTYILQLLFRNWLHHVRGQTFWDICFSACKVVRAIELVWNIVVKLYKLYSVPVLWHLWKEQSHFKIKWFFLWFFFRCWFGHSQTCYSKKQKTLNCFSYSCAVYSWYFLRLMMYIPLNCFVNLQIFLLTVFKKLSCDS